MINGESPESTVPLLAARDLTKAHGRTEALRGASVELRAGEILAVTGASGSGKSTLLHCLAGIVRPDAGSVTYAGERLDQLPQKRLSELRRGDFGGRGGGGRRLRDRHEVRLDHLRHHRGSYAVPAPAGPARRLRGLSAGGGLLTAPAAPLRPPRRAALRVSP
jgi:energy-coupling factor transporter ATP-binding protein EcfA2